MTQLASVGYFLIYVVATRSQDEPDVGFMHFWARGSVWTATSQV